jgi:hypothetical protein
MAAATPPSGDGESKKTKRNSTLLWAELLPSPHKIPHRRAPSSKGNTLARCFK